MEIRTFERPGCPVCGGSGLVVHPQLEDFWYDVPGQWRLVQCSDPGCGLGWMNPAPIEADLPLLYADYGTHQNAAGPPSVKAGLRACLVALYERAKLIPLAVFGLAAEHQRIARMFLHDLPPGRLLDVGCGDGGLLVRMHRNQWQVAGLDFDAKGMEWTKAKLEKYGFDLRQGDVFSAAFPDNSFDAVTMSHVIEHVLNPVEVMREIRRILKPGGRFVAVTPNLGGWGYQHFKDCWRDLDPPRHLQLFTLPALAKCARQAGFATVATKSSAAHADLVFGGSLATREARQRGLKKRDDTQIDLLRVMRSCRLQYREALAIRSQPDCGEEAVLICHK